MSSWDQVGLENGMGPNLHVVPSKSDSERSKSLEVAESDMVVEFPRIASCPANLQMYYQQLEMDPPLNPYADTIESQNCECRVNGSPTGAVLVSDPPGLMAPQVPAPPGPIFHVTLAPTAGSPSVSADTGIQLRISDGLGCIVIRWIRIGLSAGLGVERSSASPWAHADAAISVLLLQMLSSVMAKADAEDLIAAGARVKQLPLFAGCLLFI
ncbi:hypothetical protein Nepgr_031332 [Nepenthes gracilis]|uniref:Uncharacterized protein n=1 Tax=Nepenthes gracilis TaxID=150966 RepID=A0AAD3Y6Y9_NEPGR|nr:hypothetical protein Nepgr_031332 [Nepenthes gracilis]